MAEDYIMGLDLGPNSIGWVLLTAEFDEQGNAVRETGFLDTSAAGHPPAGVRVFEAGLDKIGTQKEASLNQTRRMARSARRVHERRRARKTKLKRVLAQAGFLPYEPGELEQLFRKDPYALRARGLTQRLEPHEFGRALFHICQRRGFQSNRKSGKAKEDRGILKAMGDLQKAMEGAGARTLGEYFFLEANKGKREKGPSRLERGELRLRARHTRRDMYKEEFDLLWNKQEEFHPGLQDGVLKKEAYDAIFFQHPFELTEERRLKAPSRANLHRAPSLKECPLEKGEKCCPSGTWAAQRFRILKEVNNLKVAEGFRRERPLNGRERDRILELLDETKEVKFGKMRTEFEKLGLEPESEFNLERGGRSHLKGNAIDAALAAGLGKKTWRGLEEEEQEELRKALLEEEDPAHLNRLLARYDISEKNRKRLVDFEPPSGYMGYSRKAIEKLLPYLEEGCNEYEAVSRAYPDRQEGKALDSLPALISKGLPGELTNLTNPVVRRALVEVRKVVNALIREYGKPRQIVVELAREMKGGPKERKEASKRMRHREAERKKAAQEVASLGGNPESREDILRYLLWKEQGQRCPYSGRTIACSHLFTGEVDIDHILPRWQSLDDSQLNKVLCFRDQNRQKGQRTPAEWLGENSEEFQHLLRRVDEMCRKSGMNWGKYRKFQQIHVEAEGFARRQLNDTRYITRLVVRYLNLLYPPALREGEKAVRTSRGGLSAELRRHWGLNSLLAPVQAGKDVEVKNRTDHRHHAIDAVVVALSSRANLKKYQDYWRSRSDLDPADAERRKMGEGSFPPPWEGFRPDVLRVMERIHVSHRVIRKIHGSLHEETFYGPAKNGKGGKVENLYWTRKPLEALTGPMAREIQDRNVREIVVDRLGEKGWDGKSRSLPKDWWREPLFLEPRESEGIPIPIRKVRVRTTLNDPLSLGHRFAVLGNNHHMEVFSRANGDGTEEFFAVCVSQKEAMERVRRRKEPILRRDFGPGTRFRMSLARKESFMVENPDSGERTLCVLQKLSGSFSPSGKMDLYFRDHRDSRTATEAGKNPFQRVVSFGKFMKCKIQKVQVDPLGRLYPAGD